MARVILFVLVLCLAFPAWAVNICTCHPHELKEDIYGSYAIFSGTVTGIRREFNPDRTLVEFDVHASWERVKNNKYAVYTQGTDLVAMAREGLTCGYKFAQGQTYLVYASRTASDHGLPWVSQCGHTKLLKDSAEDTALLGQPIQVFDTPPEPTAPRDLSPTPLPYVAPLPMLEEQGVENGKKEAEKPAKEQVPDTTVPHDILQQLSPEGGDAVER